MELQQLQEFVTLAETCSFFETAEILFLSQSTLSRHIKELEHELGVELFHRTTRKVVLSPYGRIILPYARSIIQASGEMRLELKNYTEKRNVLTVGTFPAMSIYGINALVAGFYQEYPQYRITFLSSHTTGVHSLDMLRNSDCELAFAREETNIQLDEFERLPLMTDHVVAVLPLTHPLAKKKEIRLEDLRNENIVTLSKHTSIYKQIHIKFQIAGFEPNVVMTDHSAEQLIDFVRLGSGIGLLLKEQVKVRYEDLTILSVEPMIMNYINLCYLKGAFLSPAAETFLEYFRRHI